MSTKLEAVLMLLANGRYMKIRQLFTNANGELSTTNTIQMMSAITLCIGFFIALWFDRAIAAELGFTIAGMATLTATSKGFVAMKRDRE